MIITKCTQSVFAPPSQSVKESSESSHPPWMRLILLHSGAGQTFSTDNRLYSS